MSQREKEWRKGRLLARFGKGVDPGHGQHRELDTWTTLFQPRLHHNSLPASCSPPPHRPQPHAMLTVRSPLPRNASEIIHERPGRVLHGAAMTCANSANLLLLPWPVSAGDPGIVQSVPSSSASMQCSPACRIAWRPREESRCRPRILFCFCQTEGFRLIFSLAFILRIRPSLGAPCCASLSRTCNRSSSGKRRWLSLLSVRMRHICAIQHELSAPHLNVDLGCGIDLQISYPRT
jgi:hypothetical protein